MLLPNRRMGSDFQKFLQLLKKASIEDEFFYDILHHTMGEFLKKIFSFDFLKKSDTSVLGIDIGTSSIKVVQLKKKRGKAVLETYGELALGPYAEVEVGRATNLSTEKVSSALIDLLREAKTTTKQCGVAIPIGSSLLAVIELPSVSEKELSEMIPLEARRYIPVPISEVSLDWSVIPKQNSIQLESDEEKKGEKIEVLIVAIHNDTIARYREIMKAAGLNSSFIEIEIFSTIRAVLGDVMGTVAVFDMGASSTKLYIVERGIVKSSHTINRGSQDITMALGASLGLSVTEAENLKRGFGEKRENEKDISETIELSMDYIFDETNRALINYEMKYNKSVSKVILTGGGVGYKGLLPLAQKNIETPVELGNPFAKVEFPAFLEEILRETGPEFSVAVGVALRKLQELV